MKIFIGSDHRGFSLKKFLKKKLACGCEIVDIGNYIYDSEDDYSDISFLVAEKVRNNNDSLGILICGSGAGVCFSANKVKGIRASVIYNEKMAKVAKEDDDLNILCLASDFITREKALLIVKSFLKAKFKNEPKYQRRIEKVKRYENQNNSFN